MVFIGMKLQTGTPKSRAAQHSKDYYLRFPDKHYIRMADEVNALLNHDRGFKWSNTPPVFEHERLLSTLNQLLFQILYCGHKHPLDHLELIVFMHPVVQQAMKEQGRLAVAKGEFTEDQRLRLACLNKFMEDALGRKYREGIKGTEARRSRLAAERKFKNLSKKPRKLGTPEEEAKLKAIVAEITSPESLAKSKAFDELVKNTYDFDTVYNSLREAIEK
jgi:hypothetical protein